MFGTVLLRLCRTGSDHDRESTQWYCVEADGDYYAFRALLVRKEDLRVHLINAPSAHAKGIRDGPVPSGVFYI